MEARVLAMIFLFMIIWIAPPSPSSCARLGFPTTNTLRDDYFDSYAAATSDRFNNKKYGDDQVVAIPDTLNEYYGSLAKRQIDDDSPVRIIIP